MQPIDAKKFADYCNEHLVSAFVACELKRRRYVRAFFIRLLAVATLLFVFNHFYTDIELFFIELDEPKLKMAVYVIITLQLAIWCYQSSVDVMLKALVVAIVLSALGGMYEFLIGVIDDLSSLEMRVIAFFVVFLKLSIWAYDSIGKKYKRYINQHIKEGQVFDTLFKYFGPFHYSADGQINMFQIAGSDIIPKHNHYVTYDYISGHYNNVQVRVAEVSLEKKHRIFSRSRASAFKGFFVLLEGVHMFEGKTIVKQNIQGQLNVPSIYKPVPLNSTVFESKYKAFTNNPDEAKQLLTPEFISGLLKLSDVFDSYNRRANAAFSHAQCSFFDNKLLLVIPCRRMLFHPPHVFRPVDNIKEFNFILVLMQLMMQMIESSNLDQHR